MSMNLEDLQRVVEVAVRAAMAAQTAGGGGGGGGQRGGNRLDEKYFRRCEKFNGDERLWREWAFSFRTAVGKASV